jgi:hypothetical protein
MQVCRYLPTPDDVASTFEALMGRDVSACTLEDVGFALAKVACYRRNDGTLAAMIGMDLALACSAGAALTMIPNQSVREATATGVLPTNLDENLYEVLNVSAVVFTTGDPHRLTMTSTHQGLDHDDLVAAAASAAQTLGMTLRIDGYLEGRAILWVF